MTQRPTDTLHPSEHAEVWEILPWYVNGTLEDRERASVEAHLTTCAACQVELARCHDLAAIVRAAPADGWEPSPEHFARVLARLETTTASATLRRGWWDAVRAQYERYGEMLRRIPPLIRWTLVTQSALTLVLASILVWQAPWAPERFYRTLSNSSDQTAQKRLQIHVVFADDITEKELRALLTEVQATIVAGPSPFGVYTVAVALPGDARAPADITLETLRAHPKVRLAEALYTR
jgi:anti-sigma factor RsiW